jgi:hypothetical protein
MQYVTRAVRHPAHSQRLRPLLPSVRAPEPTVSITPTSYSSERHTTCSPSTLWFFRSHRLDAVRRPSPVARSQALLSPALAHAFLPMPSSPDSPTPPPPLAPPGPDLVGYARVWVRADLNLMWLDLFFFLSLCVQVVRSDDPTVLLETTTHLSRLVVALDLTSGVILVICWVPLDRLGFGQF